MSTILNLNLNEVKTLDSVYGFALLFAVFRFGRTGNEALHSPPSIL